MPLLVVGGFSFCPEVEAALFALVDVAHIDANPMLTLKTRQGFY